MAKYNIREDLEVNDRVVTRGGFPKKEGTVRFFDEEEAYVRFDDDTMEWTPLYNLFITRKGSEIVFKDGTSVFQLKTKGDLDV